MAVASRERDTPFIMREPILNDTCCAETPFGMREKPFYMRDVTGVAEVEGVRDTEWGGGEADRGNGRDTYIYT